MIYCYSEGIPRRINNLCDFALVYAFADNKIEVDVALIQEMMRDKKASRIVRTEISDNPDVKRVKSWLLEQHNIQIS